METHLPGDYAEAAYTSFENADSQQAMEILTTGLRRFPQDANFALRAGWVALLTGNSERAYKFLLAGKRIGFPSEKLENATALLCHRRRPDRCHRRRRPPISTTCSRSTPRGRSRKPSTPSTGPRS